MATWISFTLAIAAAALVIAVGIEVLGAMTVKRAGPRMWLEWLSITSTSFLVLLQLLASATAPPLPASLLMAILAGEIYSLRKRLIWRAHNGGRI